MIYARLREIACVDENVGFWERRLSAVGVVRVGYADEADALCVVRCARWDRGRGVRRGEPMCEEKEGRRLEVMVSRRWTMASSPFTTTHHSKSRV